MRVNRFGFAANRRANGQGGHVREIEITFGPNLCGTGTSPPSVLEVNVERTGLDAAAYLGGFGVGWGAGSPFVRAGVAGDTAEPMPR